MFFKLKYIVLIVKQYVFFCILIFSENFFELRKNNILKNLTQLSKLFTGEIIIRIPVISNFNTEEEEIKKIANFLTGIRYKRIELLPYHRMGEHKYVALGQQMVGYEIPELEILDRIKQILKI